jgi:Na+-transporting NADH:ubiquinone oxidoreductase subunit NqrB
MRDARLYQILFLGILLGAGAWLRDFSLRPAQAALAFAAGLLAQALWVRALGLKGVGLRSAAITCFSVCLLLRADNLWVHPLAAALAVTSKFTVRVFGKHLFNPGNLGVIAGLLLLPGTWASPGQWGDDVALGAWVVALGALVASRARRADIAWTFLAFHLGALALRILWLGQPWGVFTHQMASGSLLLFAFFMISDPMTTPDHPRARVLYAALVAALAYLWQFGLYRPNALLWALFLASPAVPALDRLWPAPRFHWNTGTPKGAPHAAAPAPSPAPVAPAPYPAPALLDRPRGRPAAGPAL